MKVLFGTIQKQWCHCAGILIFQSPSSNILRGMSAISQSLVLYEVLKKYENDEAGAQANLKQISVPAWLALFFSSSWDHCYKFNLSWLENPLIYISELTSFKCCECSAFFVFNIYSSFRAIKVFFFFLKAGIRVRAHVAVATCVTEAALLFHCFNALKSCVLITPVISLIVLCSNYYIHQRQKLDYVFYCECQPG